MQTNISAEEFARFQSQLLEVRQQKYSADEARKRAERGAKQLETSLAAKSCELAEVLSTLSRVQRAGDIDSVVRENQTLRQKLISIESSFQLQTATLRGECERLQADNSVLMSSLKLAGRSSEGCPLTEDFCTQTDGNFPIPPTAATQTDPPSTNSVYCQTNLSFGDYANLKEALQAREASVTDLEMRLNEANRQLLEEKLQWGHQHDDLVDQLQERERQVQRLQEECEDIANELSTAKTRHERIQRDLRRQLAKTVRPFKGSPFAVGDGGGGVSSSTSSLVLVSSPFLQQAQTQPIATWRRRAAETDATSNNSFNLCNAVGGGSSGDGGLGGSDDVSETSSINSPPSAPTASFSEEDFRCLLNRLSEVQEENCSLHRQIKRLSAELEAKLVIIQQHLDDKLVSSTSQTSSLSTSHRLTSTTAAPASLKSSDLFSGAFIGVKSKLKLLDMVSLPGLRASNLSTSRELRGLKQLCEELMTRNIVLERALEETLRKSEL
ncbi:unnamed protein product [Schistocephalus solidus]|uniref:GRIP1-associated protein 1 n=1 Tax=Schistocephalus solidus TaxID=70667 RepID=A0A183T3X6_SCHSO|nr:unnamed protein product [Schistocephalus solidus]